MKERVTTGERLKELMRDRGMKQVDIIEKCQPYARKFETTITKSNVSQWVTGKYLPDQRRISVLSEALGVNPAWLMGFDVPMEIQSEPRDKRKNDALDWLRNEATKEERLEFLKELAEKL